MKLSNTMTQKYFGLAVLCLFLLGFSYHALTRSNQVLREEIRAGENEIAWLTRVLPKLSHTPTPPGAQRSENAIDTVLTLMNTEAMKPYPHQVQQTAHAEIEITFARIPFETLITYCQALDRAQIHILKAKLQAEEAPGIVNARLWVG